MKRYPEQALWDEIAYLAYHLHWDLDTLLDLEHRDRGRLDRRGRRPEPPIDGGLPQWLTTETVAVGRRLLRRRSSSRSTAVEIGRFNEVSGLQIDVDVEEYTEGGENGFVHKLPGRMTWPNLVLKRGITKDDVFMKWLQDAVGDGMAERSGKSKRTTAAMTLLGPDGMTRLRKWNVVDAMPVRWTGPTFASDATTPPSRSWRSPTMASEPADDGRAAMPPSGCAPCRAQSPLVRPRLGVIARRVNQFGRIVGRQRRRPPRGAGRGRARRSASCACPRACGRAAARPRPDGRGRLADDPGHGGDRPAVPAAPRPAERRRCAVACPAPPVAGR